MQGRPLWCKRLYWRFALSIHLVLYKMFNSQENESKQTSKKQNVEWTLNKTNCQDGNFKNLISTTFECQEYYLHVHDCNYSCCSCTTASCCWTFIVWRPEVLYTTRYARNNIMNYFKHNQSVISWWQGFGRSMMCSVYIALCTPSAKFLFVLLILNQFSEQIKETFLYKSGKNKTDIFQG